MRLIGLMAGKFCMQEFGCSACGFDITYDVHIVRASLLEKSTHRFI